MSLEQVFYLSQSIASIAVVGSLIYLGLQVRGADRSQRAVMQQGRADQASKAALSVANGELARVWQRGMEADPTKTREALDQAAFDSYCAGVRSYMSRPGFRAGWRLLASQFCKDFMCVRQRTDPGGGDCLARGYIWRVAETRASRKSSS
jgi:hypothetical protein